MGLELRNKVDFKKIDHFNKKFMQIIYSRIDLRCFMPKELSMHCDIISLKTYT